MSSAAAVSWSRAVVDRWMGADVVGRALAHPGRVDVSVDLLNAIETHATDAHRLEAWMRTLDPPTLATVVAVITGEARGADGSMTAPTRPRHG